jgi:hypothetical protein
MNLFSLLLFKGSEFTIPVPQDLDSGIVLVLFGVFLILFGDFFHLMVTERIGEPLEKLLGNYRKCLKVDDPWASKSKDPLYWRSKGLRISYAVLGFFLVVVGFYLRWKGVNIIKEYKSGMISEMDYECSLVPPYVFGVYILSLGISFVVFGEYIYYMIMERIIKPWRTLWSKIGQGADVVLIKGVDFDRQDYWRSKLIRIVMGLLGFIIAILGLYFARLGYSYY